MLGSVAWFLGKCDLQAMRQGSLDPAGDRWTLDAVELAEGWTMYNAVLFLVAVAGYLYFTLPWLI